MELHIDTSRKLAEDERGTGIFVRAHHDGRWINADICELDRESLIAWLRATGWAESVCMMLLGHAIPTPPATGSEGER